MSKKHLATMLSKLKGFINPRRDLEQYCTTGEIASTVIWDAFMLGWVKDKVVLDLGAGTGVLGIGCSLMGSSKVYFLDKDSSALAVLQDNLAFIKAEYEVLDTFIVSEDVVTFKGIKDKDNIVVFDLVVLNPPFGVWNKGADSMFLDKAMSLSNKIITFHKSSTSNFIEDKIKNNGFKAIRRFDFDFPLGNTMSHHIKAKEYVKVSCWLLEKA